MDTVQIPKLMVDNARYRKTTIRLYVYLSNRPQWGITNKELCANTGMSLLSVNNALTVLERDGYIQREYHAEPKRIIKFLEQ